MLKSIDILLGVTVVMLIVSMGVTMITQAVIQLRETRGKKLLEGISDLVQQIDPTLQRKLAEGVATSLLLHPLIREGTQKLGSTIHREEFTTLLLGLGSGHVPEGLKEHMTADVQAAIAKILKDHGITDPTKALDQARSAALQLERANPELAADVRHSTALMQAVSEQLLGKVHAWFDQTIDRVSSRFTADTRVLTTVTSVVVAFALQLDVVSLINRLSVDPALRQALIAQGTNLAGNTDEKLDNLSKLTGGSREQLQDLVQIGAVTLPGKDWFGNWWNGKVNLLGVILSALLLSLGAPFWYNALKNLIRLRSVIAGKDDEQRSTRQTTQKTPPAAPAPVPPAPGRG